MRRVVTGRDANNRSVFVEDGQIDEIRLPNSPQNVQYAVWGDDKIPSLPSDGTKPSYTSYFPPESGYRILIADIPPDAASGAPGSAPAVQDLEKTFPGWIADANLEDDAPGMHTTASIDVGIVLEGTLEMELDDGITTTLQQGDCVVQNGTRHAWHNTSDEVCRIAFLIKGAHVESA